MYFSAAGDSVPSILYFESQAMKQSEEQTSEYLWYFLTQLSERISSPRNILPWLLRQKWLPMC